MELVEFLKQTWSYLIVVIGAIWVVYKYFNEKKEKEKEQKKQKQIERYIELHNIINKIGSVIINSLKIRLNSRNQTIKEMKDDIESLNKNNERVEALLAQIESDHHKEKNCELCKEVRKEFSIYNSIIRKERVLKNGNEAILFLKNNLPQYQFISAQISGLLLFCSNDITKMISELEKEMDSILFYCDDYLLKIDDTSDKIFSLLGPFSGKIDTLLSLLRKNME